MFDCYHVKLRLACELVCALLQPYTHKNDCHALEILYHWKYLRSPLAIALGLTRKQWQSGGSTSLEKRAQSPGRDTDSLPDSGTC